MKNKLTIAKENTLKGKLFYFLVRCFIAPIVRLIWVKKVSGRKNLPKSGPYIIAVNHQSYFDFISLVCVLPLKLTFFAAEKFFSSRFWNPIMQYTGQIKVERYSDESKDQAISLALKVLENKKVFAIFPQGTRSRSGEIEKTYTGVAKLALKAKVPIIPIGIKGAFEIMPPQAKKPRLKKILEIEIGEPMDFSQYYDKGENPEVCRQVTNKVMLAIAKLADLVYKEE